MNVLNIGGFIILFYVLCGIMEKISVGGWLSVAAPCALEMTSGCMAVAASSIPAEIKIPLLCGVISFSGASVIAQTLSVASQAGIKIKGFLFTKLLHGGLAFALSYLTLKIFCTDISVFRSVQTANTATAFSLCGIVFLFLSLCAAAAVSRLISPLR